MTFIGPAGTGKTCAALALLDIVDGARKFWVAADMLEELIACQKGELTRGERNVNMQEFWDGWRNAALAVLDEIGGRERVSDFHYETIKRAIDFRESRPAIFISNLPLDSRDSGSIRSIYDDRIASRLAGGTVIRFTGRDRRLAVQP